MNFKEINEQLVDERMSYSNTEEIDRAYDQIAHYLKKAAEINEWIISKREPINSVDLSKLASNNLYLITRNDHCDYDEHCGFVVSAPSEQEAREVIRLRTEWCLTEKDLWTNPLKSHCDQIGISYLPKQIVIEDYHAG